MANIKGDIDGSIEKIESAIDRFRKHDGSIEERLSLAEDLIADLTSGLGTLGKAQYEVAQSVGMMMNGVEKLNDRLQVIEKVVAQMLISPGQSFLPKDTN
jgi:hypothetical protein